jgi:hypothetical protein
LPLGKLKTVAVNLLEVPEPTVEQALSQMLAGGSLLLKEIEGEPLVFLPHLRKAEEGIAARIKRLAEGNRSIRLLTLRRAPPYATFCELPPPKKYKKKGN